MLAHVSAYQKYEHQQQEPVKGRPQSRWPERGGGTHETKPYVLEGESCLAEHLAVRGLLQSCPDGRARIPAALRPPSPEFTAAVTEVRGQWSGAHTTAHYSGPPSGERSTRRAEGLGSALSGALVTCW